MCIGWYGDACAQTNQNNNNKLIARRIQYQPQWMAYNFSYIQKITMKMVNRERECWAKETVGNHNRYRELEASIQQTKKQFWYIEKHVSTRKWKWENNNQPMHFSYFRSIEPPCIIIQCKSSRLFHLFLVFIVYYVDFGVGKNS